MKHSPEILLRQLRLRYIAALSLIAALIIAGQFLIQIFLGEHAGDTVRTHLVSTQIGLARDIGKDATSLQFTTSKARTKTLFHELDRALLEFSQNHHALVDTSHISHTFAPVEMLAAYNELEKTASKFRIINGSKGHPIPNYDRLYLAQALSKHLESYRSGLNTVFIKLQDQNTRKISKLQTTEWILMALAVLVLMLEGLFVFHPAIKSLEASFDSVLAAQTEAEHALKVKSVFLGKMSHEIKNPLNAIVGMSHLMLDTRMSPDQRRFSKIIYRSATGLKSLLESLLDFSKLESNNLVLENVTFSLFPVIEKAADIVAPTIYEKGVELILDVPPEVCFKTQGDPTRLGQVLVNLLYNAAKFTSEGEIILTVRDEGDKKNPSLRFSIADTGCGISENEANIIFNDFSQANPTVARKYGGTGLGLSISKQIIEAAGGTISFVSKPNEGSEFYFSLPLKNLGRSKLQKSIETLKLHGTTLVISPNSTLRETLVKHISYLGPSNSVASEKDALLFIENSSTNMEVQTVILDSRLVDMGTLGFVQKLRKAQPSGLRFFLLLSTAHASDHIIQANYFGINRFLFKPIGAIPLLRELDHSQPFEAVEPTEPQEAALLKDERPLKLLVVDDSRDNRLVLEAYFSESAYVIDYAQNGELAIHQFKSQKYDLVLMDIEMPIMNGYEATEKIYEIQGSSGNIPVVALTAYELDAGKVDLFAGYVRKPIDRFELFATIRKLTPHITAQATTEQKTGPSSSTRLADDQLALLIPKYIAKRRLELETIFSALNDGEYKSIVRIGHNLKGSAAIYGFPELGKLGDKLEDAAREEDESLIRSIAAEISKTLDDRQRT